MTSPAIALVTGATQGLGLALTEGLAERLSPADTVYLTGRNPDRVMHAVESLPAGGAQVRGELLDVADPHAADRLAAELRNRHGGIDIVFGNAVMRVGPDDDPRRIVADYAEVNNFGTVVGRHPRTHSGAGRRAATRARVESGRAAALRAIDPLWQRRAVVARRERIIPPIAVPSGRSASGLHHCTWSKANQAVNSKCTVGERPVAEPRRLQRSFGKFLHFPGITDGQRDSVGFRRLHQGQSRNELPTWVMFRSTVDGMGRGIPPSGGPQS
ncbi:SDR family NAD(P)-dependent oxidoreductase [Nocardia sp. NPDC004123]